MRAGWVLVVTSILIAPSLLGCATLPSQPAASSRETLVPASTEETWKSIRAVLGKTPIRSEDARSGILRTGWVEGWGERRFGLMGGNWRHRYRLTLQLEPQEGKTLVRVASRVEERAPAGPLALRWQPVDSDGSIESDFLNRLNEQVVSRGAEAGS